MADAIRKTMICTAVAVVLAVAANSSLAQDAFRTRRGGDSGAGGNTDYKAAQMLKTGLEVLAEGQDERGLKLVQDVPQLFPRSRVRFDAHSALASYHIQKGEYDLALRHAAMLLESETPDHQAEALYDMGICHYSAGNYDKAFISLRKVTNQYPWSVYANESFYYIGQCHFKLGRWNKAVEALEMVGTSVPLDADSAPAAEAGQRVFVKVVDQDLIVLSETGNRLSCHLETKGGDAETIELGPLGKSGEYYIGSVQSRLGKPEKGDGVLQISGGETMTVSYEDSNTESGERNRKVVSQVRFVSTASVGFTDGAYREYLMGLFADQDCFLRVKDLDLDLTDQPDRVNVRLDARYKIERTTAEADEVILDGVPEDEYVVRDTLDLELVESGAHTGIFVATFLPRMIQDESQIIQGDEVLAVGSGDEIVVNYTDEAHMLGSEPRELKAVAKVLVGQIQDVRIEHRVVPTLELKARKELIEAKIYLRLGSVFKDVGLTEKAEEKAEQGLERVEEVIRMGVRAGLERALVEEAFSIKWDLLLVKGELNQAIGVCRALMRMFPDSTLVDKALFKIGEARMAEGEINEAIRVFSAVTGLQASEMKAEARFRIAQAYEVQAREASRAGWRELDLSRAMLEYKRCADQYPDSPFAGEAIGKIADYYLSTKDYRRVSELMERVFQDYPDASFLDEMLIKWALALYRLGDYRASQARLEQFMNDYPGSPLAEKAQQFKQIVDRKVE